MRIKIITTPVIDSSGLMRSPQSDIGSLYSILRGSSYGQHVSMKDFRFFYYDPFYDSYKSHLSFRKEQFYDHKNIISLVKGELRGDNSFYREAYSLYSSISSEFQDINYLILPISILVQFSLEYLLSALIFGYFFKQQFPKAKLIFFGTYESRYIEDILKNFGFIDGITRRGDKFALLTYIQMVEESDLGKEIKNFTYRGDNVKLITGEEEINANINVGPDYTGFDLQVHKQQDGKLVLSYELGKGCKNNCFYCYNIHKGGKYIVKDIQKIMIELKELSKLFSTNLFHFDDDEINYSNEFLLEFSHRLIEENINIYWTALIIPSKLERGLLQKLYFAGCRQLRFGVESGSQRILDIIGKGTNILEIEEILKNCKEIGISTYASFIVDLPQETNLDIKQTGEFIFRNKGLLDNVAICAYNSHLGTFDQRYLQYIQGSGDYNLDRTKRFSKKKLFLRKFCDKLGMPDIDVIQFMKKNY